MARKPDGRATRVWISAVSVSDFDRALRFYRDALGFPVALEARDFGWMEVGPGEPRAKIGLSLERGLRPAKRPRPSGVVLEVGDMDAFAKRLRDHGVRFTREPTRAPWGGIVADFLDPDGNEIEAVEDPGHYTRLGIPAQRYPDF